MSLVGNLQDLALNDIFQIISMSEKSGVLWLAHENGRKGKVVFWKGKVVSAWSPRALKNVKKILDDEQLSMPGLLPRLENHPEEALTELKAAFAPSIIDEEKSEALLAKLSEGMLTDLLRWRAGTFSFEMRGNHPTEVEIPPGWIWIGEGFDPSHLLAQDFSEEEAEPEPEPDSSFAQPDPEPLLSDAPDAQAEWTPGNEPEKSPYAEPLFDLVEELRDQFEGESKAAPRLLSPGLDLLKSMLFELHRPDVHTYITLLVLRYASALMNRAVLFEAKEDSFVGIGEFGLAGDKDETAQQVRQIRVPREEKSIFSSVEGDLMPFKTKPNINVATDKYLVHILGGTVPEECFLGPLVCEQRLVGVLYGDHLPERKPIGDTASLEIFLSQAGIAMERALRERTVNLASAPADALSRLT